MINIITFMAIMCGEPKLYNDTKFEWNVHDVKMYKRNMTRCGQGRYKDTPCVSYFRKVGERDYHLVCKPEGRE